MNLNIPEYMVRMVRRPPPVAQVVPGTTPVLAFGDPFRAEVATLGINPSWREFLGADGRLLAGPSRRLATLGSLGAEGTTLLTDDQIRIVVNECAAYFHPDKNPFRRWFDPLDLVLRAGLGVSYYDGSACHLDLVQWATAPAWRDISPAIKQTLLEESLPHFRNQLQFGNIQLIIPNGRLVLDQLASLGLAELRAQGTMAVHSALRCSLFSGQGDSVQVMGWSANLQSTPGITREFRNRLASWLRDAAESNEPDMEGRHRMASTQVSIDAAGYIIQGTARASKDELFLLLKSWLETSDAPTIGDFGNYGRKPYIFITLDGQRSGVLNADTKRAAVEKYVTDAQTRGPNVHWSVIPNRRTRQWNKLVFEADRTPTPGWYCYLRPPNLGPEEI